jgi:micrococcal nuclease
MAKTFKHKPFLNWLVCWLLLSSISCSQKKQPEQKPAEQELVAKVIDGDTFVMTSGKTVRIAGIDTPELGERLHDEARDCLANLILGKEVSLKKLAAGKDRYERILAEVFVDTLNVGLAILGQGLAQLYIFSDNAYIKDRYLPVLKNAINSKLGVWSLPPPKAENYYLTVKGSYRFHRPLCQSLKNANPENLRKIVNRIDALFLGLSPCRNCHP